MVGPRHEAALRIGRAELPELPHGMEESAEPMAAALSAVREVVADARPEPVDAWSYDELADWVERTFTPWLRGRGEAIARAHAAIEPLDEGELEEHVVGAALLGAVLAQLAEDVATMPLPREIREDPREQVLHRDAFVRAAAPLYRRASDAFGECAASTVQSGMDALEPWAAYCEEALRRLEDAPRPVSEPERAGD